MYVYIQGGGSERRRVRWVSEWDAATHTARVYPQGGRTHDLERDNRCWCLARYEPVEGGAMWVHNEGTKRAITRDSEQSNADAGGKSRGGSR
jgi:hypothetical protein